MSFVPDGAMRSVVSSKLGPAIKTEDSTWDIDKGLALRDEKKLKSYMSAGTRQHLI